MNSCDFTKKTLGAILLSSLGSILPTNAEVIWDSFSYQGVINESNSALNLITTNEEDIQQPKENITNDKRSKYLFSGL